MAFLWSLTQERKNARKDVSSMTMAKSEKNSIWVQADADIDDMIFQAQGSSEEATCSER